MLIDAGAHGVPQYGTCIPRLWQHTATVCSQEQRATQPAAQQCCSSSSSSSPSRQHSNLCCCSSRCQHQAVSTPTSPVPPCVAQHGQHTAARQSTRRTLQDSRRDGASQGCCSSNGVAAARVRAAAPPAVWDTAAPPHVRGELVTRHTCPSSCGTVGGLVMSGSGMASSGVLQISSLPPAASTWARQHTWLACHHLDLVAIGGIETAVSSPTPPLNRGGTGGDRGTSLARVTSCALGVQGRLSSARCVWNVTCRALNEYAQGTRLSPRHSRQSSRRETAATRATRSPADGARLTTVHFFRRNFQKMRTPFST
jgi:hypothetical protein